MYRYAYTYVLYKLCVYTFIIPIWKAAENTIKQIITQIYVHLRFI